MIDRTLRRVENAATRRRSDASPGHTLRMGGTWGASSLVTSRKGRRRATEFTENTEESAALFKSVSGLTTCQCGRLMFGSVFWTLEAARKIGTNGDEHCNRPADRADHRSSDRGPQAPRVRPA